MGKHVQLDESKPRKLFISRSSSYAKNCKTGYQSDYHNAHHVVPCTSINKSLLAYLSDKPYEYNKALARFTKWNVNEEPNLLGLPHKHAYEVAYQETTDAVLALLQPQWKMKVSAAVALMYPIHLPSNFGHPKYSAAVESQLDAIWDELSVTIENHEPVEAGDMGAMIQAVSNTFRGKLMAKVGQTKADWKAGNHAEFMMV